MVKEFAKYDQEPEKWIKQYTAQNRVSKKDFNVDVGYERFLGPEIFFHPEFANPDYQTSISTLVDDVVQGCPIDVRRGLYKVRLWGWWQSSCGRLSTEGMIMAVVGCGLDYIKVALGDGHDASTNRVGSLEHCLVGWLDHVQGLRQAPAARRQARC